jgi:methionine-rich copper-binding protein CopC
MNTKILTALASLALLAQVDAASAHAHLKTASPAPDSTVQAAPQAVSIDFTEGVEPKFSTIEVQDAAGRRVDKGPATTGPSDDKHFSVGLKPLTPGIYKVIWHATAIDTHKTEGMFQFTIKP